MCKIHTEVSVIVGILLAVVRHVNSKSIYTDTFV
jgi:hypothetical protein